MQNMDANTQPRGRGRGRGFLSSKLEVTPGPQPVKEKTVNEVVKQLHRSNIKSTVGYLTRPEIPESRRQEILDESVEEVCNTVLDNIEFVEVGTEFLKYLWDADIPGGLSIRRILVTRIQTIYRVRGDLTATEFQNYAALLCELFGCLTINSMPLNALTGPVYSILQDLLLKTENSQDNVLTFHMLIRKHGSLLERLDKVRKFSK